MDFDAFIADDGGGPAAVCGGGPAAVCGGGGDDDDFAPSQVALMNASLLAKGDVEVAYAAVLPCLTVPTRAAAVFRPFKLPGGAVRSGAAVKTLGARRRPGGGGGGGGGHV